MQRTSHTAALLSVLKGFMVDLSFKGTVHPKNDNRSVPQNFSEASHQNSRQRVAQTLGEIKCRQLLFGVHVLQSQKNDFLMWGNGNIHGAPECSITPVSVVTWFRFRDY